MKQPDFPVDITMDKDKDKDKKALCWKKTRKQNSHHSFQKTSSKCLRKTEADLWYEYWTHQEIE